MSLIDLKGDVAYIISALQPGDMTFAAFELFCVLAC